MTTSTRRSFVVSEAVAARVAAEHPHPHAERLRIAVVEAGGRRRRVVYGGSRRLEVGDVVPVALPGTGLTATSGLRLPPLRARNFRGVRSEAMLCSSDELGWTIGGPDEVLVLDDSHEVGVPVRRPSGRCHGPGCTQTADGDFCSPECSQAWHADLAAPTGAVTFEEACRNAEAARPLLAAAGWSVPDDESMVRAHIAESMDAAVQISQPRGVLDASGAASPQVASDPDPSRGWLAAWFDRLFGRTT